MTATEIARIEIERWNQDAANPPCPESFIAAEFIWGPAIKDCSFDALKLFIGLRMRLGSRKEVESDYAEYWLQCYQHWTKRYTHLYD